MTAVAVRPQNPFPGLRPFKTEESTLFFGRDDQIGEALDRMMSRKLLAVVGVSGCGKSSLVTAGMVPALEMGLAGNPEQHWRIATMRPGDGPLRELARCLNFGEALAERTYGLLEAVETHLTAGENLLLIVDQFEEIFPFRDRKLLAGGGSEADLFVSYLLRAAQDPAGRVYVLLTMRSDYLGECAKFHGLPEALNDGQYLVPRMTRQQLQEAIEGPLEAAGVKIHPALVQELLNQCDEEPDNLPLLQHLLRRMFEQWDADGAEGLITPIIAKSVGGLAGALDQDAEQKVCRVLSSEELRIAEVLFRRITESRRQSDREEEDRPVRRPQTVTDLATLAGVAEVALLGVVRRFEERGLLVLRHTDQGDKVDLPHECLCLHWARLKQWIRAESEDSKKLRFLWDATERRAPLSGLALEEALEWERNGRLGAAWCSRYLDAEQIAAVVAWVAESHRVVGEAAERERQAQEAEQRREAERRALAEKEARREAEKRRARIAMLVVGIVALAFAGLGIWAYKQSVFAKGEAVRADNDKRLADRAREDADMQRARAEAAGETAKKKELDAEKSEEKAEEEAKHAKASLKQYLSAKLALQSAEVFREDPSGLEKAALLAIESIRTNPTVEGDEALRQSISLLPDTTSILWNHTPTVEKAVAFSLDGKWLATGTGGITLLEAATGKKRKTLWTGKDKVSAAAFSLDGKWIAFASGKVVRVLEVATGNEAAQVQHNNAVNAVALSPDGKWLATGSADSTARVTEVATRQEVARFENLGIVQVVALSPDGKWLATGSGSDDQYAKASDDKSARVMDVKSQQQVARFEGLGRVRAVALSPDGKWLATGSGSDDQQATASDKSARVMDVKSQQQVAQFKDLGIVRAVALSPDGKWLATGSDDKTARVFEVSAAGQEVTRLPHEGAVRAVVFAPDGKSVRTFSDDSARAMEAPSARQVVQLQNYAQPNQVVEGNTLAFSPDGRLVATGSVDNFTRVMEARTGRVVRKSSDYGSEVTAVAFSPDGKFVTSRTKDSAWMMEATPRGTDRQGSSDHRIVYSMAFSPDGRFLASGGPDRSVIVTDVGNGHQILKIEPNSAVYGLAFSPDGKWLLTGGADATARLWDSANGKERETTRVTYPWARVYATAFSPDGKWLATGSGSVARVREVSSGREYHIDIGKGIFAAARLSQGQDGFWLETVHQVSETDKGLIYTRHPLDSQDLIRAACAKLTRNLTKEEWEQQFPKEIPRARTCENLPFDRVPRHSN